MAEMQKANAHSQASSLNIELEDGQHLMASIISAHFETCDFTKNKIASFFKRNIQQNLSQIVRIGQIFQKT